MTVDLAWQQSWLLHLQAFLFSSRHAQRAWGDLPKFLMGSERRLRLISPCAIVAHLAAKLVVVGVSGRFPPIVYRCENSVQKPISVNNRVALWG